jgi:hypothetical protein
VVDELPVEEAGTARIDLGGDHVAGLARVGGVDERVLEGLADELVVGNALVDLGLEVLTSAVLEHVLATCVTRCLGAVGGLEASEEVVVDVGHCHGIGGRSGEDDCGGSQGQEGGEEPHRDGERHNGVIECGRRLFYGPGSFLYSATNAGPCALFGERASEGE